jgi:hypothetical protein
MRPLLAKNKKEAEGPLFCSVLLQESNLPGHPAAPAEQEYAENLPDIPIAVNARFSIL